VIPMTPPQPQVAAQAARATGGRPVEVPAAAMAREAQAPLTLPPAQQTPAPSSRRRGEIDKQR